MTTQSVLAPPSAKPGRYSVHFQKGTVQYGVEWRWSDDGRPEWTMSSREDGAVRTEHEGSLTEEGRQALIKHFGLESVAGHRRFSLNGISNKSPQLLATEGAEHIDIASDFNPKSDAHGHISALSVT